MSKTVAQIFAINPVTTILDNDLFYLVNSPYTPGTDAAISGLSLKGLFLQTANNLSDLPNKATARTNLGVAIGVNVEAWSAVLDSVAAGTYTGSTSITTLGTITTGTWNASIIDLAHGGSNANLTASNGGIVWSNATQLQILSGTATARQMLQSGASGAPAWSTATWPATTTINQILYSSAANVVGGITTANNGVLVTSAGGVPSISSTLPSGLTIPGFAASGANADITSMSGLTGAISKPTTITFATGGAIRTDTTAGNTLLLQAYNTNTASYTTFATLTANNPPTFDLSASTTIGGAGIAVSPLTTKGDIWAFSTVNGRFPVATGDGKILQVSSGATFGLAYSTPTYPSASGSAGTLLRSDGTNNLYTTTTYPNTNAINTLLYASAANVMSALATANNGLLVTSSTGVPSILAGPGTTGNMLLSNAAAAPSFSTSTIPSSAGATANKVLLSDGTNYVLSTPTFPNASATAGKFIRSDGTNWIASTPTLPTTAGSAGTILRSDGTNFLSSTSTFADTYTASNILYSNGANTVTGLATANNGVLITNGSGVPSIATQIVASNLPSGTMFNFQSTNTTTVSTTTSSSFAAISGVTVTITPTSSSNKVLVRAVLQTSATSTAAGFFQLARGGSAIGVGAAAGSRTVCGAASIGLSGTATMQTVVMEFLDSPATTSATTYTAQWAADGGVGTISLNASNTDTNTSSFPRTSSTISVYEIKA